MARAGTKAEREATPGFVTQRGTRLYAVLEAGTPSPQLLIQIQPLYWGLAVSVGDDHLAWRIGPIAAKFGYGPMSWKKKFQKGIDTPWS